MKLEKNKSIVVNVEKIESLQKKKGLNDKAMAYMLQIENSTYNKKRKNNYFTVADLYILSLYFDVQIADLITTEVTKDDVLNRNWRRSK